MKKVKGDEVKYYQIGDREYFQNELTLSQSEKMTDVLLGIFGTDDFLNSPEDILKTVISQLIKHKLIGKMMGVVLIEKDSKYADKEKAQQFFIEAGNLPMSQVTEIVNNFLSLNGHWTNSLKDTFETLSPVLTKKEMDEAKHNAMKKRIATSANSILNGETKLK